MCTAAHSSDEIYVVAIKINERTEAQNVESYWRVVPGGKTLQGVRRAVSAILCHTVGSVRESEQAPRGAGAAEYTALQCSTARPTCSD